MPGRQIDKLAPPAKGAAGGGHGRPRPRRKNGCNAATRGDACPILAIGGAPHTENQRDSEKQAPATRA
eukprot:7216432-Pyramimonas_sp.AAC.1